MKKLILLSVFALFSSAAFGQEQPIRYQGEVQAGYAFGVGDIKIDRLSVHMINGVRFNPYLSAGVGVGLDYYDDNGISLLSMPLFANVKGYLPVSPKVSLFASFDMGYSVALKSEEESGWVDNVNVDVKVGMKGFMVTPAIGASFEVGDAKAFNISLCYDLKKATADVSAMRQSASATTNCNAIGLKVGFAF